MAAPIEPRKPEPCPECGAAMDRVPRSDATPDEMEPEVRLVCPRCNHETAAPTA